MMAEHAADPAVGFDTEPSRYRHWRLTFDGPVATLAMDVDPDGSLFDGVELKLNSYDVGVDVELADAVQRLRFEHPEVRAVLLTSAKDGVFCAGANIRMLAAASHPHKVNFCKLTNETRNAIEDASANSGQVWVAAVNGPASGGGYELALACERIVLVDDGSSAVSLPEVPLLGVLPGTGGLTRLVDKRLVRRDHADVVCTVAEGVRGQRAVDWRLVDGLAKRSTLGDEARRVALELAERSDRPADVAGVPLPPLDPQVHERGLRYRYLDVRFDGPARTATFTVRGPQGPQPTTLDEIAAAGAAWWPLALARELDDAVLRLRFGELELGLWVLRSEGEVDAVAAVDEVLLAHAKDWFVREVTLLWKRTLQRLDVTSRSLVALVEPGSCFAGTLAELVLAADRSFMLDGTLPDVEERGEATMRLTGMNLGPLPSVNGLSRLATRFWGRPEELAAATDAAGRDLDAEAAVALGLVTFAYDDIDWPDETRLALQERASLSPDALTGMEANLRFPGPETLETKVFGRLSAWQNWVFQRPSAAGEQGALRRYGTGSRPDFDPRRV